MGRLLAITAGLFVAEAALFTALTPLLARYAELGSISKFEAGVLSATYAIGVIPGSVAAGILSRRIGIKRVTVYGVVGLALTTAAFGVASDLVALDLIRTSQGFAAGFTWSGSLAWLLASTPYEVRGRYLGAAYGMTLVGTVLGPLIGIAAVSVGETWAFGTFAVVIAALVIPLSMTAAPGRTVATRTSWLGAVKSSRSLRFAVWLVAFSGAVVAIIGTLLPLKLAEAGVSAEAVGLVFFAASLLAALAASAVGRLSDRHGAATLTRRGLFLATPLLVMMGLDLPGTEMALTAIVGTAACFAGIVVPAGRLAADAGEDAGLLPDASAPLIPLSTSIGESVGPPAGAALASATNEAGPFVALAFLAVICGWASHVSEGPA